MPSIEISAEQAQALARGEDITIKPARPTRYILVFDSGNVFDVLTNDSIPCLVRTELRADGECKLLVKGRHYSDVGSVQPSVVGQGIAVRWSA